MGFTHLICVYDEVYDNKPNARSPDNVPDNRRPCKRNGDLSHNRYDRYSNQVGVTTTEAAYNVARATEHQTAAS